MKFWKSREWYLLMGATFAIFGVNLYFTVTHQNGISNDFSHYAKFIDPIKLYGTITTPHFIYPLLVAIASILLPSFSYAVLGACIVLFFQLLLAPILWMFWKKLLPEDSPKLAPMFLTVT